ncbi:MAG: type III pantothenate kinase [Alphaproteobacteria bacterium]|nr:type III pantothenate kinase [Alphaproteobacteria bacterium]
MLLAIDAGNTNIVFAVFDGSKLLGSWRSATNAQRTADEHFVFLQTWLYEAGIDRKKLLHAVISNVVPEVTYHLHGLCRDFLGIKPMMVGIPDVKIDMKVVMDQPDEVGADRLVNAIAGLAIKKPPLLILDFGTATTIDVVNAEGDYAGGVIAPGPHLSLHALHNAAARLPRVEFARPQKVIGTGTVSAMQSGIFWGYIGMIEGLISRMKQEVGKGAEVIATGGLASLFADATDAIGLVDKDLTLRGLQIIHERNSKAKAA